MTEQTNRVFRDCLGHRARMVSRAVSAIYDSALSNAGLKVSQFSVLSAVMNSDAATPGELAKSLKMDESTISRNIERMCSKGWLRLETGTDRRSHTVTVTEKGAALVRKAIPEWEEAQGQVEKLLGSDGVAALKSVARKLRA